MLLMIRINLLGRQKGARTRRVGPTLPDVPNLGILVFVLLLVIEGAVFYLWQMTASDGARSVDNQVRMRDKEYKELENNKRLITEAQEQVTKLKKNKLLFDEMFAEKVGPVNALTYLSFVLQPRDEAITASDELKAMEAAGWRVNWDARRAWMTSYRELGGEVTLQGEALSHEDVAELQRRLESSPFFRNPKLVYQDVKKDDKLGVPFVDFSIRAWLVYLVEPIPGLLPPGVEPEPAAVAGGPEGADAGAGDGEAADGHGDADGDAAATDAAVIGAKTPAIVLPLPPTPAAARSADAGSDADAAQDAQDAVTAPDVPIEDAAPPVKPAEPKPEPAKAAPAKDEPAKAPLPAAGSGDKPPPAAESAPAPSANEP
ncbi:MAG: PilN domain-containing protein [Deltaproteobacteria bacterium]|nr:PilN domain-containing protein [Deltaproteobacteria bacterium]